MGFILKDTCGRCGAEARKTEMFSTKNKDYKVLCQECLAEMGVNGFVKYRNNILEKVTYEDLLKYENMRADIISLSRDYSMMVLDENFDKDYTPGMYKTTQITIGDVCITPDYIAPLDYPNLVIKPSDVIAVTMETSNDFNFINADVIKLSFFTKNPFIPYYSTFYAFKTKISFSNKKQKAIKANVIDVINGCCAGLKYEINTPSKVLKKVRWDFSYNIPEVKKKHLCSWLADDRDHAGYFKTKKILKQYK